MMVWRLVSASPLQKFRLKWICAVLGARFQSLSWDIILSHFLQWDLFSATFKEYTIINDEDGIFLGPASSPPPLVLILARILRGERGIHSRDLQ